MTVFGPIKTGPQVVTAMIAHLRYWEAAYLREIERQVGLDQGELIPFASYPRKAVEPEKWPEDALPACLVVSPGIVGEPWTDGDGDNHARWSIGIATITSATTEEITQRNAQLRFAAMRSILVQHPALGAGGENFAEACDWKTETYDELPDKQRSLGAGYGIFEVQVAQVVNRHGGLLTAPEDPTDVPEWPEVTQTEVTVERSREPGPDPES